MRKAVVALIATSLLAGPLASVANAGVYCDFLRKLGYENVRECEDF